MSIQRLRGFGRRFRFPWRSRIQVRREVDDELAFHLAEKTRALEIEGLAPDEARAEALRQFGDLAGASRRIVRDDRRGERISMWLRTLDGVRRDTWHACRSLWRSRAFAATIVAAIALGIGINTAIFSVVNAVLLKPLPFSNPDTLVAIENTSNGSAYGPWTSPAKFAYWREQTEVFSDVAAISQIPRRLSYTGGDLPEQVTASQVSAGYFHVLDAPVVLGRGFSAEEDRPAGPHVVVIGYEFWQRYLSGAEDVLGSTLPLSGETYTIVGVLDHGFDLSGIGGYGGYGDNPDLLVPFQLDPESTDQANFFINIGRLKPGVSLDQAAARTAASAAGFRLLFPAMPPQEGFTVMQAREAFTTMYGDPRARLWVLLGAVSLVLLIAGANVANMLLMRSTGRLHEIAIRSTLGAGRGRVLRQLLTESLLLSLLGGFLGLFIGNFGIRALLAVNTAGLPRLGQGGAGVDMDWRVVSFAMGVSLLLGLLFGLVPALAGSRHDLNSFLKSSGARSSIRLRQYTAQSAVVAVEVGLAAVLLIGAALLIRTSLALNRVDPGIDPANVLTMATTLPEVRFQSVPSIEPIVRAGLERMRLAPGVESVAATYSLPLQGAPWLPFEVSGRPDGERAGNANYATGSEGYFHTFGVPVIRGRAFTARDNAAAPAVAVINEAMAAQYWADDQDPLEDTIVIGGQIPEFRGAGERRIVGIVGDVRYGRLGTDPKPTMYVPLAQATEAEFTLIRNAGVPITWVARTEGQIAASVAGFRDTIREATGVPVVGVQSMERLISASVSREKLNMLLMTVLGGSALLLAAVGIYGIMAYAVQQRIREIGIRMALGGDSRLVMRMIVKQGMQLVAIGIAAGLVTAFFAADVLASWLFEVEPRDPLAFAAVPAVLLLIAFTAVWAPAQRASRVDPAESLRCE